MEDDNTRLFFLLFVASGQLSSKIVVNIFTKKLKSLNVAKRKAENLLGGVKDGGKDVQREWYYSTSSDF